MSLDNTAPQAEAAPADAPMDRGVLAEMFAAEIDAETNPPPPAAKETPAAPVEAAAEPATGDEPVEAAESTEPEPEAPEAPPVPAITAPSGMSEEDRAKFAQLTPEMQSWLTQRYKDQGADYTRKTQAVAEQTKAVTAERQALAAQLEQYGKFLSTITTQELAPPNPAMQMSDPERYSLELGTYLQAKHNQEQARAEAARVAQQHSQIAEQNYREFVNQEKAKLLEIMPEFGDDKKAPALKSAVMTYASEHGFGDALGKATANEIAILVKAMRYDQAEKAKAAAPKVVAPAPKAAQPTPAKGGGRPSNLSVAIRNLDQSANPSRDDLAAAFLAELNSER